MYVYTLCGCWRPEQAGPGIQSFTKVTATPPVPITFLGSSFNSQIVQDLTSCGPIKLHRHGLLCVSHYPHKCKYTQLQLVGYYTSLYRDILICGPLTCSIRLVRLI